MNLFSQFRADNFSKYTWLCDETLANWIADILCAYGNSILDVGCGNGFMLDFYCNAFERIGAIDPSETLIETIKKQIISGIEFQQAFAENIPYPNNSFDICFSKSSLHHFQDVPLALSEMKRIASRAVAVLEVVAPTKQCLPFLKNLLTQKEKGRKPNSVYTCDSLREIMGHSIATKSINSLYFDQYIDIQTWIQYSDLSNSEQEALLASVLSMDPSVAVDMQLHLRNNRYVMLRRMCLCIAFINE